MKQKILIAGCHRSGTTAIFNLTRIICELHGKTYSAFEDQFEEQPAGKFSFEIVKAHRFRQDLVDWANVIITTYREPLQIKDSMSRFAATGGRQFTEYDLLRGLSWWGMYQQNTDFCVNYNQIERAPEKLADIIARKIGVKIRHKMIIEQFQAVKPPTDGYDDKTLLWANHITQ